MRDKNGIETRVEDEYGIKTLTFIFASIRSRSLQIRKKNFKVICSKLGRGNWRRSRQRRQNLSG